MGSNGCEDVMSFGSNDSKCSEATVEIKIKTLDSQTYTLRVDKCVPVTALKEQIATVTGVLSEQQRLICRGKVLNDDQLLSAYHVEDGHTLHLVVRQPIPPSSEDDPVFAANDPTASSTGHGLGDQVGPSIVIETYNFSQQGGGSLPDFGRIISAVLGSFGIPNVESGSEGVDLHELASERLSRTPTSVSLEPRQPPVIPDSLTTLSHYLSRMRQEFSTNVRGDSSCSQTAGTHMSNGEDSDAASRLPTGRGGLPTPASLAEIMLSTRQMLNEQAGECLLQLTRQLEDHANLADRTARIRVQVDVVRLGGLLQSLGAFLLELGRTTMTLRMGHLPADTVINAGPAVFISPSGPNPIMVQPHPFQPGTSFEAVPVGMAQNGHRLSSGTVDSAFLRRNIDTRVRTGSTHLGSATEHVGTTQNVTNSPSPAPTVGDEGPFLSNLLRHIIPIVSQSTRGSNNSSAEGAAEINEDRTAHISSTQPQESPNRGTSSPRQRRQHGPSSSSSSKRQKRE
ncbi:hypothetical protein LguiA_036534 [Lonicera macranthoides]